MNLTAAKTRSGQWSSQVTLLAARVQAGLTQQELAKQSGVSRTAIARMETTSWRIASEKLERIAAVLGISKEALLPPTSGAKTTDAEERLRSLYERGISWAEIEAEFPGRSREALRDYAKRRGWQSPCRRRPSRSRGVDHVSWSAGASRFFFVLVYGAELLRERRTGYPYIQIVEWALSEARATRTQSTTTGESNATNTLDELRTAAITKIEQQRRTLGRRTSRQWAVGDEVRATFAITASGRQRGIRDGVIIYTSPRFVVVEFEHYRESYAPEDVWTPTEEPPGSAKLSRSEVE